MADFHHFYILIHDSGRYNDISIHFDYSPALKKWGYTGFAMSFCDSVIPWSRDCKIKMHFA